MPRRSSSRPDRVDTLRFFVPDGLLDDPWHDLAPLAPNRDSARARRVRFGAWLSILALAATTAALFHSDARFGSAVLQWATLGRVVGQARLHGPC